MHIHVTTYRVTCAGNIYIYIYIYTYIDSRVQTLGRDCTRSHTFTHVHACTTHTCTPHTHTLFQNDPKLTVASAPKRSHI